MKPFVRLAKYNPSSLLSEEGMVCSRPLQASHPRPSYTSGTHSSILVLLLGATFGTLADKHGRRLMYALAMFGILSFLAWTYLVCT